MGILLSLETFGKSSAALTHDNFSMEKIKKGKSKSLSFSQAQNIHRQKVVRLGKAFKHNQMLGYVDKICDKAIQIFIYI